MSKILIVLLILSCGCAMVTSPMYNTKKITSRNIERYNTSRIGQYYLHIENDSVYLRQRTEQGFTQITAKKRTWVY